MDSIQTPREQRGRRRSYQITLIAGWLYCVSAQAQLLEMVPSDVAAVTVVRNPREFLKKANATIAKLWPGAKPIEWSDIEARLGPAAAGFCDIDQPLVIVLTRAEGEGGALVIGSKVKPPTDAGPGGVIAAPYGKQAPGGPRDRYFARAGNLTYVCDRRRPLRSFSRLRPATSLATVMDREEREVARSSDLFVYIRMEAWQERIRPYVSLVSTMAKFSVTAEPSENPIEQKMRSELTNWFIDGAVSVLDQMSSVSLGLTLDGDAVRLRHHHHFTADGSVANYLGKARKSDEPPWACLPDRPFFAAFATQWWSPEQSSVVLSMTQKVFDAAREGGDLPPAACEKVIDASRSCYSGMRGMNILMTMSEEEAPHMEFFGSYAFKDAEAGLKQMRVIQANANEAMAAITPGGFVGRGRDLTHDGVSFNEVDLNQTGMGAQLKNQITQVYGPDAKVRQARVGKTRVASCINESADDFVKLVKAGESAQPLMNNKRIKNLMGSMQSGAQAWLLLDLHQLTDLAASVVASEAAAAGGASGGKSAGRKPQLDHLKSANSRAGREIGPLLGWSAKAGDRYFSGEFVISVDDAATAVKLTGDMIERLQADAETPPSK